MSRSASILDPVQEPRAARLAAETLRKAEAMGLISAPAGASRLAFEDIQRVIDAIQKAGIVTGISLSGGSVDRVVDVLERVAEALEQSPVPQHEWGRLMVIFEAEELARLLGISISSLRRYQSGSRPTPDDVAARLHMLALVVGDLRGAYNDIGVRRWFHRRRETLGDRTPAQMLRGEWTPENEGSRQVRDLARSLNASPAT